MCDWATDTPDYGRPKPLIFFGSCAEYMDALDVFRADLDAFMQEQRRHHTNASSFTKARSTRVMSPPSSLAQAPPAVSRAGPFFSPVATPTFSPVAPHEAESLVGDIDFPSFF